MAEQSELEKVTISFPKALDFDGIKDLFTYLSKTVPNSYLKAGGNLLFQSNEEHRNLRDRSEFQFFRIQRANPLSGVTLDINYRLAGFSPTGEEGYVGMEPRDLATGTKIDVYNNVDLLNNVRIATENYFTRAK